MKSRYCESRTAGIGSCNSCFKPTNWILTNYKGENDFFCCNKCLIGNTKNFKGKSRIVEIIKGKKSKVAISRRGLR